MEWGGLISFAHVTPNLTSPSSLSPSSLPPFTHFYIQTSILPLSHLGSCPLRHSSVPWNILFCEKKKKKWRKGGENMKIFVVKIDGLGAFFFFFFFWAVVNWQSASSLLQRNDNTLKKWRKYHICHVYGCAPAGQIIVLSSKVVA